jgi:sarcosine oxidase
VRVAVVGAGVVGLAATAALLDAGADVVCYERAGAPMGERSAGSSRIFRLAHADPGLVHLATVARDGFAGWAHAAGRRMVEPCGCVVSGGDAAVRAKAMEQAGAPFELVEPDSPALRLPGAVTATPVLIDPGGGIVDVDAVRAHLTARAGAAVVPEPVHAVDDGVVHSGGGAERVDAVLIAAGAGTSALAAQVGIDTPAALEHHVRFTVPFADAGPAPQAWIDTPADGLATYQHRSGPGRWSVGGSVDAALVAWDGGRDAAEAASRDAVLGYARERLRVEPRVVDSLYCTHVPGLGDGIEVRRSGRVLAVYGENLMKFAPVLGTGLAAALADGSTPTARDLAR